MGPSIPTPDPDAVRALLARRLQVVAGKGGVGRTTVAVALARRAARDGKRTLLLEVDAPDDAASALGVKPAPDTPREVENNLWLCRLTPWGSLREYALIVLKFKALYNLVFENRLVKYLLRSIPSLGEYTMLGKTWYHAMEKNDAGEDRYERIIIDAPATGHAITFLSVARTVADVAPKGLMREYSEKMAAVLESKNDACIHIVCVPEEMPVNEGLDVLEVTTNRVRMTPGLAIVNRVLTPRFNADEMPVLDALARSEKLSPYARAAQLRIDREAWQSEHAQRFAKESGLPAVTIHEMARSRTGWPAPQDVMEIFDRVAGEDRA